MNRIAFTADWDKLREPRFTTIRSYRPEKEEYYRDLTAKTFQIWLATGRSVWNGRKLGEATLRRVEVVCPRELPAWQIHEDVLRGGRPDPEWFSRLMGMEKGLLLTFENHTGLLRWPDGR